LSQDDLGSLRTDSSRRKRQNALDYQLRSQLRDVRRHEVGKDKIPGRSVGLKTTSGPKVTGKKSSGIQNNEVERLLDQNKEERRKRRTTEDMLSKAEEDCRLLHKQLKTKSGSSTNSSNVETVLQQPPVSVSTETPTTSREPNIHPTRELRNPIKTMDEFQPLPPLGTFYGP
jgi:hypothetical protein